MTELWAHIGRAFPPISEAVLAACLATCISLLAAALIVLSLLNLQGSTGAFSLDAESRRERGLAVVRNVQLTIWASGLGALDTLAALVWSHGPLRWVGVGLTFIGTTAFLSMAARTVSAVVAANSKRS